MDGGGRTAPGRSSRPSTTRSGMSRFGAAPLPDAGGPRIHSRRDHGRGSGEVVEAAIRRSGSPGIGLAPPPGAALRLLRRRRSSPNPRLRSRPRRVPRSRRPPAEASIEQGMAPFCHISPPTRLRTAASPPEIPFPLSSPGRPHERSLGSAASIPHPAHAPDAEWSVPAGRPPDGGRSRLRLRPRSGRRRGPRSRYGRPARRRRPSTVRGGRQAGVAPALADTRSSCGGGAAIGERRSAHAPERHVRYS